MKKLAVIACVSTALAATSAFALDISRADANKTVEVCQSETDLDTTLNGLSELGWSVSERPYPNDLINALSWALSESYIVGDSGGQALEETLDLHRKLVLGYSRKVDVGLSATRVLQRKTGSQTEGMILQKIGGQHVRLTQLCTLALVDQSLPIEDLSGFERYVSVTRDKHTILEITKLSDLSYDGVIPIATIVRAGKQFEVAQ